MWLNCSLVAHWLGVQQAWGPDLGRMKHQKPQLYLEATISTSWLCKMGQR